LRSHHSKQIHCSQELKTLIRAYGKVLDNNILKVDAFLNHQVHPETMLWIGRCMKSAFEQKVTKILTVESSGIAPAFGAAVAFNAPLVFARKKKPITMTSFRMEKAPSHTKNELVTLYVSEEMIRKDDQVLIVDDFLASGQTIAALGKIVRAFQSNLVGICTVIEKTFEGGRDLLEKEFQAPVLGLIQISSLDNRTISFAD